MKRRDFLKSATLATGITALGTGATVSAAASGGGRQFFELRRYRLRFGPQQKRFDNYARNALIPALKRAGVGPVGVFRNSHGQEGPSFNVLIPYQSLDQLAEVRDRLATDKKHLADGKEFLATPSTDPSYDSLASSVFVGFAGMPRIEVPPASMKSRVFELRTYQSHSLEANRKKVEMFNVGEIAIFRETGLRPVFFGEAIIGDRMPRLTYMLVFESMAARDEHWKKFGSHPDWKALRSRPEYADSAILSRITNVFLRPTGYSEI